MSVGRGLGFTYLVVMPACLVMAIALRLPLLIPVPIPLLAIVVVVRTREWRRKGKLTARRTAMLLGGYVAAATSAFILIQAGKATKEGSEAPANLCQFEAALCATRSTIQILSVAGGPATELPLPAALYRYPAWSPDGRELAVVLENSKLVVIRLDTLAERTVASIGEGGFVSTPAWSPNGRYLAFTETPACQFTAAHCSDRMVVVPSAGGAPRTLAGGGDPIWSPAGDWIAFNPLQGGVSIVRPDGSDLRQLASEGGPSGWTPDGRSVIVALPTVNQQIDLVDVADGHSSLLTSFAQEVQFSPDGHRLAFLAGDPILHVWASDADGGGRHQLSQLPADGFSWSPDGTEIAISSPIYTAGSGLAS